MFKIKFPTKPIFRIFPIIRINGMSPFCNLFIELPSYMTFYFYSTAINNCTVFYLTLSGTSLGFLYTVAITSKHFSNFDGLTILRISKQHRQHDMYISTANTTFSVA